MNNPVEPYGSEGEQVRGFWAALQNVRIFFSRLIQMVSLTEEDLMDAGVYLRRTRD